MIGNSEKGKAGVSGESQQTATWTYEEAFSRNLGIIDLEEQKVLRNSRVAVAGMGGIGGIDVVTLARLGVGKFTIADPDTFEPANANRQFGAMVSTLGKSKVEVMAGIIRDINPEADVRVFTEPIGPENSQEFLRDADLFIDAIEVFEIDVRRLLFRLAAAQGIHSLTAGPVGFSAIWIVFHPEGMTFDRYFDLRDGMDAIDQLVAFAVGVTPKATQRSYMDLRGLDVRARRGPSSSAACHIAAGAMAVEVVKILLKRGRVRVAPNYHQFDPYVGRFARGYLLGGNRHPWQRLKRFILRRALQRQLTS
jgi:molybdopterin/thiamine biosynthesis adenylyltransferase